MRHPAREIPPRIRSTKPQRFMRREPEWRMAVPQSAENTKGHTMKALTRGSVGIVALVLAVSSGPGLDFGPVTVKPGADAAPSITATYGDGVLRLNVSQSARWGSRVGIEVLDDQDQVLIRRTKLVPPGVARWHVALSLDPAVPVEDLAWYRLRLDEGGDIRIVSMSEILQRPVIRLLAQNSYAAGSKASARVIATNLRTGRPLRGSVVRLELLGKGRATTLFSGRTDALGTVAAAFDLPERTYGSHELRVTALTHLGRLTASQPVNLERRDRILLTTDKPVYQPGQTMHVRALALNGYSRQASANQPVTLEVEDGKGNRILRQRGRTDRFGIASAEFHLAEELNLGTWRVRAIVGAETPTTQEKTVTVDRYVLPKFKVEIELAGDAPDHRSTAFAPGDRVEGTVIARYLFGKPVANGEVSLRLATFDVETVDLTRVSGRTDHEGRYAFSAKLPDVLPGRSTEQGAAPVSIVAEVRDTAEHAESRSRDVLVSSSPIRILALPESGALLPGLENRVYLLTSYADGSPAQTTITGNFAPGRIVTDAGGVGVVTIPAVAGPMVLKLRAADEAGRAAESSARLEARTQAASLQLRMGRSIARVGESVELDVASTRARGAVYLDLVRDGQTLLTRALETEEGHARLTVDVTPEMAGTLEVRAWEITADADPVTDRRFLLVEPADELTMTVGGTRERYAPGDEAQIDFRLTDTAGRPVVAALGIEIVDEAVFALSDRHPGFERVFLQLQQELLTPRVEIHQMSWDQVVRNGFEGAGPERIARRERAAEVLFAAAGTARDRDVRVEAGRDVFESKRGAYHAAYARKVGDTARKVAKRLVAVYEKLPPEKAFRDLVEAVYAADPAAAKALVDPWGRPLQGEGRLLPAGYSVTVLRSLGPDGRPGPDDITVSVPFMTRRVSTASSPSSISAEFLEDLPVLGRNFQSALALAPGVNDAEGGVHPNAQAARERDFKANVDGVSNVDPLTGTFMANVNPDAIEEIGVVTTGADAAAAPRVRKFFPETLYVNPALITDGAGRASIRVPLADSITTWRLTALASTEAGALGSQTAPIRVLKDFFIDLDLPVAMTQGDVFSLPVAIHNDLPAAQRVRLELRQDPWFTLVDDVASKTVTVAAGEVRGASYRIRAAGIGARTLQVTATLEGGPAGVAGDAIERPVEVRPNGREQEAVINDRLERTAERRLVIPDEALPGASRLFVKLYPGVLSQLVEGLDSILRMPSGCFEQTSSSTYPNVLVLDYLKATGTLTPEVRAKAEQYVSLGYQRLVTFEVPGGGFSWFGQAPANKILTAYGLMEFFDMSRVHEVDPRVIERTRQWLAGQQRPDGSFQPDASFINEGATNRYREDILRITAYIGWALARTGARDEATGKARAYVRAHATGREDAYTLAVIANFAAAWGNDTAWVDSATSALAERVSEGPRTAFWKQDGATPTSAQNSSADLETTALAAQALLRSGRHGLLAKKALDELTSRKDSFGNWSTTQATILALGAFRLSLEKGQDADTAGTVEIVVDGKPAGRIEIAKEDNDLLRVVDLTAHAHAGAHDVSLTFAGQGSLQYQIVGRYFLPWGERPVGGSAEPLTIAVTYDRTRLAQDDTVTARVRLRNETPAAMRFVMADLGIPPGFDVAREDFERLERATRGKTGGRLEKHTITPKQAILYFDGLAPHQTVEFSFSLRARFPLRAQAPSSRTYAYYNPAVEGRSEPVELTIAAK